MVMVMVMRNWKPSSVYLVGETQNSIWLPISSSNFIINKFEAAIGVLNKILARNTNFANIFVSKHDSFMSQFKVNKEMITTMKRNPL